MVVRHNYSLRESVLWGIKELKNENIRISGVVVNACDIAIFHLKINMVMVTDINMPTYLPQGIKTRLRKYLLNK